MKNTGENIGKENRKQHRREILSRCGNFQGTNSSISNKKAKVLSLENYSNKKKQHETAPTLFFNPSRQSCWISDYDAFLQVSQDLYRTDYPSSFQFLKVFPSSLPNLNNDNIHEISPLSYSKWDLVLVATELISRMPHSGFYAEPRLLQQLVVKIAENYKTVPYHNFSHGFSLMQLMYRFLEMEPKFNNLLSNQEKFFILISALAHDINHPGINNQYEVKLKTNLAKRAGNEGVLQKMHIHTFLSLMKENPSINVLSRASNPQSTKKFIIRMILATDISQHFSALQKMRNLQAQQKSEQDRLLLIEEAFHACDLGNACLQFDEYMNWASLLSYQFNEQTKLEEENEVKITEFFRFKSNYGFLTEQINFINVFVYPLWKQLYSNFPKVLPLVQNIENNILALEELKNKQKP